MSALSTVFPDDTVKESGLESDSSFDDENTYSIFTTIKEKIQHNEIDLRDPEKLDQFANKYGDFLGESASGEHGENRTLLHLLVDVATDQCIDKYEPLVKLVINEHPDILEKRDRVKETSLYYAVSMKRNELVRLMCSTHTDINKVLRIVCSGDKDTCVHAAIRKSVAPDLTLFLIGKASEEVLCIQDSDEKTPLHIAVEYKRCTKEQLQVVETLAKRCKEAMYKRSQGLSPYLDHMRTRAEAQTAAAAAEFAKGKRNNFIQERLQDSSIANGNIQIGKDGEGEILAANSREEFKASAPSGGFSGQRNGKPSDKHSPVIPLISINQKSSIKRGPLSATHGEFRSAEPTPATDELPRDCKDQLPRTLSRQDTSLKKPKKGKKKKKQENDELLKVTDASADAVKDLLMLHCMRTMKAQDAVDFLYGKDQGKFFLAPDSGDGFCTDRILTTVIAMHRKRNLFRFVRPTLFRDHSGSDLSRFLSFGI